MRAHRFIHGLAILSLFFVALKSILGSIQLAQVLTSPGVRLSPVFGLIVWSWLLWKIWKRPRQWGFGVGVFLFLMIAFQSYLWWRGIHNPRLATLNADRTLSNFILVYELPIFIAGVCCALLRFCCPKPNDT